MAEQKNIPSEADDIEAAKRRRIDALQHVKQAFSRNRLEVKEKRTGEDPAQHYEWAPYGDSHNQYMAHLESLDLGYVVCNKTNSPKLESRWKRQDGTHVQGDQILVMCPKEMKEAAQEYNDYRARERDRRSPAGFDAEIAGWAKQNGVAIAPIGGE